MMLFTPSYLTVLVALATANPSLQGSVLTEQEEMSVERIQVTGERMRTPGEIELSSKRLRQPLPAQDGADLLRSITGFHSVRKGGASADAVFRGMSGSRLTILTDGDMTLGGCPSRMDPPTAYITPQAFDYVNLVKGPQAVTHGPMTAAGTVRFERDWQQQRAPGSDGFMNVTAASYGRADANIDVTQASADGYVRGAVNLARSDDYQDGDGNPIHSAYQRWNTSVSAARHLSPQQTLVLTLGLSDGEAAYADRGMDGSRFRREALSVRHAYETLNSSLTLLETQYFYNYVDHVMDNFSLRQFSPGMMPHPAASNPDRRTQGGRVRATIEPNDRLVLVTGIDGQRNSHRTRMSMDQNMQPYQALPRVADADIEQWGLFSEARYAVSMGAEWVGGLRVDRWQARDLRTELSAGSGHGHSHGSGHVMPNPTFDQARRETLLGGFVRFEGQTEQDTSWYAGIGYAERFPDYWELIGGSRQTERAPNAFNVKHETTVQGDVGLISQTMLWQRPLQTSTSIFYGVTHDYLLLEMRSHGDHHSENLMRNIDTHHYGVEWDAEYQMSSQWQAQSSVAYTRATNRSDERALAQQPPLEVRVGLSWAHDNLQIGGLLRAAARQHRVAPHQGTIAGLDSDSSAGFAVASLNSSWQSKTGWVLSAGVDNLFDTAYAEHLSRQSVMISGYVPAQQVNEPGRTLWANVEFRW